MAHEDKNPTFSERIREQLLLRRILVLDGVLDDDNGTLLATQLLTLAAEDPAADVALWINSPGGSVPSMLAIRDVMRLVPCDVSTLALGLACSAGQFLQADELVRMRADIEAILSAHTGQSVQALRADTDRDRVLTARAAVEYGIVDQVLGQRRLDDAVSPAAGSPAA